MDPIRFLLEMFGQLLLPLFILLTLVAMAGGNPASVLSPVVQILIRLLGEVIALAFKAALFLIKLVAALLPALISAIFSSSTTASKSK